MLIKGQRDKEENLTACKNEQPFSREKPLICSPFSLLRRGLLVSQGDWGEGKKSARWTMGGGQCAYYLEGEGGSLYTEDGER